MQAQALTSEYADPLLHDDRQKNQQPEEISEKRDLKRMQFTRDMADRAMHHRKEDGRDDHQHNSARSRWQRQPRLTENLGHKHSNLEGRGNIDACPRNRDTELCMCLMQWRSD